ncbi:FkbM family methyltransferase [Kribbella sp. NBC_01484]|uniref:FkbM family methyltransferase n=1 Tax=Kribbella sp. NBC_01484 TaxID=2903579 RepID=UPI002E344A3C|nr:FkbM family methyltransferase [Kribbella sp. NBC_01484]
MAVRDGAVRRAAWSLAHVMGRVLGSPAARRTARLVGFSEGRRRPRTDGGEAAGRARWRAGDRGRAGRGLCRDGAIVQEVPVIRLDDWAREHALTRLDVVKLDIEGGEIAALSGATRTLKRLQPRALLVEDKRSESSARLHTILDEMRYLPAGETLDQNALFRPESLLTASIGRR